MITHGLPRLFDLATQPLNVIASLCYADCACLGDCTELLRSLDCADTTLLARPALAWDLHSLSCDSFAAAAVADIARLVTCDWFTFRCLLNFYRLNLLTTANSHYYECRLI